MKVIIRLMLPILVLLGGYAGMKHLANSKPDEEAGMPGMFPPGGRKAQEVKGIRLKRTDYQVTLSSQGIVRAHNSTSLTPRVAGRVMRIHPSFENGAFFKKGTVLLELDPSDFESALASAEAQLARAEAALAQEIARAEQALLDWKDLGYTDPPGELVLRKPQMKEADANVKAATAGLSKAQRDLEHTKVLSPYDGCVLSRDVGPGQSVGSSTTLGAIFSTDYAEIRLPLSAEDLKFIELSTGKLEVAIPVVLTDAIDLNSPRVWNAHVTRSEGVLDTASRELFVVARIDDPYGLISGEAPLRVGQPVTAQIEGTTLKEVFIIPRACLRAPNQVVLVNPEDSTIERRNFVPVWSAQNQLVVKENLEEDWWLVTSSIAFAANGSEVVITPAEGPESVQTPEETPEA